jgi:glycosyltransferase involved in cell wall biosynthesis
MAKILEKGVASSDQIAVVVPVFNEAATIGDLVRRTLAYARNVIIVDDGSMDETLDMLIGLPVTVLRHAANKGKGASLVTGFRAALDRNVFAVVTLDGDGQHRPEDIPKLLARAQQDRDKIVIGSRLADRAGTPMARYCANRFADFWISWASGHLIEDSQSGFRLIPRRVLESVQARHDRQRGFVFESEFLINAGRAGFSTVSVPIPALYCGVVKRDSYFCPITDINRIVLMVAGKLLSSWMYPAGLIQVFKDRRNGGTQKVQPLSPCKPSRKFLEWR